MLSRKGLGLLPALSVVLLAHSRPAAAQVKFAIVNTQAAILGTAEIKKADADMQAKYTPRQTEMEGIKAEVDKLTQQIQTGQDTMDAQKLADLNSQLTRRQRELQRRQEDYQADFERDRNEVLSSAETRMAEIVKKLAEERGFDVVLEATSLPYFKDSMDITKDAIVAYDKAYPVAAQPAAAAPAKPPGN